MKSFSETLESYLIPAEEGLFSKIRENRAKKKIEKEQRKKLRQEALNLFKETSKSDYIIIKKLANDVINKARQKWKSLPYDIYFNEVRDRDQFEIDIAIFKDEWCMNEFDEKYLPESKKAFNFIYHGIKEALSDKTKFKNNIKVEIVENNYITIMIEIP